jgi:predicted kinase
MIDAVLLTGAPGAGKTALAKEMGELLFHAEEPHAVIDLDELARVRAAVPDDHGWERLVVENLRAIWPNYVRIGIRRVVLAGIIQSAASVDAYRSAMPGTELTVVRLQAPLDTLDARLHHREPGTHRTFLLDLAPRLDAQIAALAVDHLTLENPVTQSITTLARHLLTHLDWPTPAA